MAKAKKTDAAPMTVATPATFTWGEGPGAISFNWSQVPEASLIRLADRTVRHILSNEGASAFKAIEDRVAKAERPSDADMAILDRGKDDFLVGWRANKIQAILDGTLGTMTARGPKRVGLERHLHEVALARITDRAKALKKDAPKGEALVAMLAKAKALPEVVAEAKRRYEAETATGGDELDTLFDDMAEAAE